MAVPHYVYLLLKMLGKKGVLTLRGDLLKSYECDKEEIDYTSTSASRALQAKYSLLPRSSLYQRTRYQPRRQRQSSIKPASDVGTKTIQLQEGDSSKTAIIGTELGDK